MQSLTFNIVSEEVLQDLENQKTCLSEMEPVIPKGFCQGCIDV